MSDFLAEYLQDHLSGATFAVQLLDDLAKQERSRPAADLAVRLRREVEADRQMLERLIRKFDQGPSSLKKAAGWISQQVSRLKLDLDHAGGLYEAIELLSLGVLGKRSLWSALQTVAKARPEVTDLDLPGLIERAVEQHAQLESLRLSLAKEALRKPN